jgi:hypothetical protein
MKIATKIEPNPNDTTIQQIYFIRLGQSDNSIDVDDDRPSDNNDRTGVVALSNRYGTILILQ